MSFRLRLTMLASLAVSTAIVGTSFAVFFIDRQQLLGQVDRDLRSTLSLPPLAGIASGKVGFASRGQVWRRVGPGTVRQLTPGELKNVNVVLPRTSAAVHASAVPRDAGAFPAKIPPAFSTRMIGGVRTRVLTTAVPAATITVSRSLVEVDRNLAHLRWLLLLVTLGGIGAAVLLGLFVSGRATAPLRRLTETTERIVATGDLSERTGRRGRDEISRLSTKLDELLASLEQSLRTQRQLVADASHELRTPIATLRANVGLLARPGTLAESERAELLADVEEELESMTTLVGELVELARGEEPDLSQREFRLDELVQGAVERTARRAPGLSFRTRLEPTVVSGVPERVERAVANLLDNARKWGPPGSAVDIAVHGGLVEVRDRGPGIASEDLPLIFDRFYRSKTARGKPGAGLGLSIVKQIADAHGGTVTAETAPDGGAVVRLQFHELVRTASGSIQRPRLS